MFVKAHVFGCQQGIDHRLRYLVVVDGYTVSLFEIIPPDGNHVGRINFGSQLVFRILQLLDGRHITYASFGNGIEQTVYTDRHCNKECPQCNNDPPCYIFFPGLFLRDRFVFLFLMKRHRHSILKFYSATPYAQQCRPTFAYPRQR